MSNNIIEGKAQEIRDVILQGADCSYKSGDPEYSLYPLTEKATMAKVEELVRQAIQDWLKKFMDEVERQGEVRP